MASFKENFQGFRGDLIYGLAKSRSPYIQNFLGLDVNDPDIPYVTIDQFNEHVPTLPGGVKAGDKVPNPVFEQHRATLETHAKYSPKLLHATVPPDKLTYFQKAAIDKQSAQISREDGGAKDGGSNYDMTPREKQAFRRSSKFGIEYVLKHTAEARIHFVLDDFGTVKKAAKKSGIPVKDGEWGKMDMTQIVPLTGSPEIKGSITGSELRYLYRNWDDWIKATKRVHFYLSGFDVPPPWEQVEWEELWNAYKKRRNDKMDRTAQDRVVPFEAPKRGLGFQMGRRQEEKK